VGIRSGSNLITYEDGILANTCSASAASLLKSIPLEFGRISTLNDVNDYFNGLIDDVRIFNYALTAAQIKLLYNGGAAVQFAPASGAP
jgi:hypothetical protein